MADLLPLYREMAAGGANFHGLSVMQHSKQIASIVKAHNIRTVLDYGSGRGDAYHSPHKIYRAWGLKRQDIRLYDPSFPQHDKKPDRRFDLVICSDVLEHIPEADVDKFIYDLFEFSKRHVWASVCCRPAKKTFPTTGENLHVTVRPFDWWQAKFAEACPVYLEGVPQIPFTLVETP